MDTGETWIAVAGIAMVTVIITVLATVVIIQLGSTWRARMSVQREESYQRLAAQSSETAAELTEQLRVANAQLAEIETRLAEVERMLREVG